MPSGDPRRLGRSAGDKIEVDLVEPVSAAIPAGPVFPIFPHSGGGYQAYTIVCSLNYSPGQTSVVYTVEL